MKRILFGISALFLMASCSGNGASEKVREDSARIADSIAQVEAAKAAVEQARLDSIRQDSIAKAEVAAQYDALLNQYIKAANNPSAANANKSWRLGNELEKVKDKLTPEQRAKFEKAKKKRQNNYAA